MYSVYVGDTWLAPVCDSSRWKDSTWPSPPHRLSCICFASVFNTQVCNSQVCNSQVCSSQEGNYQVYNSQGCNSQVRKNMHCTSMQPSPPNRLSICLPIFNVPSYKVCGAKVTCKEKFYGHMVSVKEKQTFSKPFFWSSFGNALVSIGNDWRFGPTL